MISRFASLAILLTLSIFLIGFTNTQSDTAIQKLSHDFVDAFNQHDAEKMTSLFSSDADLIKLNTSETIHGKNNLLEYFKNLVGKIPNSTLKIAFDHIDYDQEGIATAKGTAEISSDGQTFKKSAFKAEFDKVDDEWQLDTLSLFEINPPHAPIEQLKELSWLIGSWVDKNEEEDDIVSHFSFQWGKDKNFIIETFNMKVLGQDFLDGHQIIGWDPIKKKIRSWIFDSQGSFGESFWTKDGNQWYANTVYYLADGRKGSAVHIYAKEDDNNYNFSSESRDLGGLIQPNIGPFQIVKKTMERNP